MVGSVHRRWRHACARGRSGSLRQRRGDGRRRPRRAVGHSGAHCSRSPVTRHAHAAGSCRRPCAAALCCAQPWRHADEDGHGDHQAVQARRRARGAGRRRRRRHHRHRGQGLRPPEGPHRALSRRRVRGRLPAQDQARSRGHRRPGRRRGRGDHARPPAPARSATARSSSGTWSGWCASAPASWMATRCRMVEAQRYPSSKIGNCAGYSPSRPITLQEPFKRVRATPRTRRGSAEPPPSRSTTTTTCARGNARRASAAPSPGRTQPPTPAQPTTMLRSLRSGYQSNPNASSQAPDAVNPDGKQRPARMPAGALPSRSKYGA